MSDTKELTLEQKKAMIPSIKDLYPDEEIEYTQERKDQIDTSSKSEILMAEHESKGYYSAVQQIFRQYYHKQIMEGVIKHKRLDKAVAKLKEIAETKTSTFALFITISPPKDKDLQYLQNIIQKILKKKWVTDYVYNIEYYTDNPHLHSHMMLRLEDKPCHAGSKEIKQTCLLENYKANVKVVYVKDQTHYTNVMHYIMGDKVDEDKLKFVKEDDEWRKKNNLQKYYTNINSECQNYTEVEFESDEENENTDSESESDSEEQLR